jgi:phospholipid-transporting ATPase
MELYVIDAKNKKDIKEQIARARMNQIICEGLRSTATVVSGESLFKILASADLAKQFYHVASSSSVLIACRMSPKQKADIVRLVIEKNPKAITLAIGDGANDVNMINAAHIGVGISGVEGQQAVSASDYAIGQFKYLKNLLFVHGRESYRKNSYLVCYTFYKNVLFVMPQFWYGFYSAFSGQVFYEKWIYQVFNITFTAFPPIIFAIFDQEHSK